MRSLYPNDCSAACSERAVWDFVYPLKPPYYGNVTTGLMSACEEHKESIYRAALIGVLPHEVTIKPHKEV